MYPAPFEYDRTGKGPLETKLIFDATIPLPSDDFPKRTQAHPEVVGRLRLEDYLSP